MNRDGHQMDAIELFNGYLLDAIELFNEVRYELPIKIEDTVFKFIDFLLYGPFTQTRIIEILTDYLRDYYYSSVKYSFISTRLVSEFNNKDAFFEQFDVSVREQIMSDIIIVGNIIPYSHNEYSHARKNVIIYIDEKYGEFKND